MRERESLAADELAVAVYRCICEYGSRCDGTMIEPLGRLYGDAVRRLPEDERLRMFVAVVKLVEERTISVNGLNPFLFIDPSPTVVSTAALHATPVWLGTDEDPLVGVRELSGLAQQVSQQGEEWRAVAILSGMMMLGDRRITEALRHCWRHLSPEGRITLSHMRGVHLYAPVVDWLLDWLEDCEGGEFGSVAAALTRWSQVAKAHGVVEVRRALPIWSRPIEEASTHIAEWTFAEFAERIRPRLEEIAERESGPRVMHDVLEAWELGSFPLLAPLGSNALQVTNDEAPRRLISLIPEDALRSSQQLKATPLSEEETLTHGGDLLVCWGIFDPYHPTWNCLGRLHTEDPNVSLLFYRTLTPFRQDTVAIQSLVGADWGDGALLAGRLGALFEGNILDSARAEGTTLFLTTRAPSFAFAPADVAEVRNGLPEWFIHSPGVMGWKDLEPALDRLEKHWGDPWARASAEWEAEAERPAETTHGAVPTESRGSLDVRSRLGLAARWWNLVVQEYHWAAEVSALAAAWKGVIAWHQEIAAQAGATPVGARAASLVRNAYSLDALLSFETRFGFPLITKLLQLAGSDMGGGDTATVIR